MERKAVHAEKEHRGQKTGEGGEGHGRDDPRAIAFLVRLIHGKLEREKDNGDKDKKRIEHKHRQKTGIAHGQMRHIVKRFIVRMEYYSTNAAESQEKSGSFGVCR